MRHKDTVSFLERRESLERQHFLRAARGVAENVLVFEILKCATRARAYSSIRARATAVVAAFASGTGPSFCLKTCSFLLAVEEGAG